MGMLRMASDASMLASTNDSHLSFFQGVPASTTSVSTTAVVSSSNPSYLIIHLGRDHTLRYEGGITTTRLLGWHHWAIIYLEVRR